jgi:hypothetical protein
MFPQLLAAILTIVTLLTGRVYQDGLGGLRAVLFYLGHSFFDSLQVRPHNLDQFVRRERLLGILLLGIDDMKSDMTLE